MSIVHGISCEDLNVGHVRWQEVPVFKIHDSLMITSVCRNDQSDEERINGKNLAIIESMHSIVVDVGQYWCLVANIWHFFRKEPLRPHYPYSLLIANEHYPIECHDAYADAHTIHMMTDVVHNPYMSYWRSHSSDIVVKDSQAGALDSPDGIISAHQTFVNHYHFGDTQHEINTLLTDAEEKWRNVGLALSNGFKTVLHYPKFLYGHKYRPQFSTRLIMRRSQTIEKTP